MNHINQFQQRAKRSKYISTLSDVALKMAGCGRAFKLLKKEDKSKLCMGKASILDAMYHSAVDEYQFN